MQLVSGAELDSVLFLLPACLHIRQRMYAPQRENSNLNTIIIIIVVAAVGRGPNGESGSSKLHKND